MSEVSGEKENKQSMNCAKIQSALPMIMETGGSAEEEQHLMSCPTCSDLVADLRYIAEQAKLLLPMHDPSPRVWSGIQEALDKQGFFAPGRAPRPAAATKIPHPAGRVASLGWVATLAAALAISVGVIYFHRSASSLSSGNAESNAASAGPNLTATASDDNDIQLLYQMEQSSPAMKSVYATSLHNVNAYIAEAKSALDESPNDVEVREHLKDAYAQKAILYEMAMERSLQ